MTPKGSGHWGDDWVHIQEIGGPWAGRVVVFMGHPWELWDTQERGEGTGEGRDAPGGYGTLRRLGKLRDL